MLSIWLCYHCYQHWYQFHHFIYGYGIIYHWQNGSSRIWNQQHQVNERRDFSTGKYSYHFFIHFIVVCDHIIHNYHRFSAVVHCSSTWQCFAFCGVFWASCLRVYIIRLDSSLVTEWIGARSEVMAAKVSFINASYFIWLCFIVGAVEKAVLFYLIENQCIKLNDSSKPDLKSNPKVETETWDWGMGYCDSIPRKDCFHVVSNYISIVCARWYPDQGVLISSCGRTNTSGYVPYYTFASWWC